MLDLPDDPSGDKKSWKSAFSWAQILEILRDYTPLGYIMAARDPRNSVTFTIAMVALAAKLAKADGEVTVDEVETFRQIFHIEAGQEASVARVFNLCRQDVAGYPEYARQIVRLFGTGAPILEDVMDALFHISMADGVYHPDEDTYLETVAGIFGISPDLMRRLKARHVPNVWDPYLVLGISSDSGPDTVRTRYRQLVREAHPDVLIAKGLPEEMRDLANRRLADINRAYEEVSTALKA